MRGDPARSRPGDEKVTTTSGGADRWYFRHVPTGYTGTEPVPVVLDLHGYAEGATVHQLMSDLGPFGDDKGFVTITPQGTGPVPRWDTALDSPDVAFVGDLLDEVEDDAVRRSRPRLRHRPVERRVHDLGHRVQVRGPHRGRGAGRRDPRHRGMRPVPRRAGDRVPRHRRHRSSTTTAGSAARSPTCRRRTVPGSGSATRWRRPQPPKGPTIEEITAAWAKRNGCKTTPSEEKVASDVTLITFSCPNGAEAELYRVEDGGHTWPGSEFSKQVASVIGPTTSSISANELMWKFFEDHPLTGS